jgi:hypothetical protein
VNDTPLFAGCDVVKENEKYSVRNLLLANTTARI